MQPMPSELVQISAVIEPNDIPSLLVSDRFRIEPLGDVVLDGIGQEVVPLGAIVANVITVDVLVRRNPELLEILLVLVQAGDVRGAVFLQIGNHPQVMLTLEVS